jgi:catechol 2,3-dioxygenase-like lactoylglutathione lyase family enzyme
VIRINHVNLPVPPGRSEEVAGFYIDLLGLAVADRWDSGRAGAWLDLGDGAQVHLSERDVPSSPDYHVAFVVDDFEGVRDRAANTGIPWIDRGAGRAFLHDPAGNLIELFAPEAAPG